MNGMTAQLLEVPAKYASGERFDDIEAKVYRLLPPIVDDYDGAQFEFVIATKRTSTYVFPANSQGRLIGTWMPGSFQDERELDDALLNLGYEVVR